MNDLDTLRPEVAQALGFIERNQKYGDGSVCAGDIDTIRAELLRLQSTESRANEWQLRAEKAEAELAALKTRVAGSCRADGQRVFDLLGLPIEYGGTLALVPVEK